MVRGSTRTRSTTDPWGRDSLTLRSPLGPSGRRWYRPRRSRCHRCAQRDLSRGSSVRRASDHRSSSAIPVPAALMMNRDRRAGRRLRAIVAYRERPSRGWLSRRPRGTSRALHSLPTRTRRPSDPSEAAVHTSTPGTTYGYLHHHPLNAAVWSVPRRHYVGAETGSLPWTRQRSRARNVILRQRSHADSASLDGHDRAAVERG